MKFLVTNIQQFCLHDGPGIRTTVFLKGCSLHCPWCCNPENINSEPQYYFKQDKCIALGGRCEYGRCPFENTGNTKEQLQKLTPETLKQCKSGALGQYGIWYETDDLFHVLIKDKPFWGGSGGITFSGGEPLLQINALEPLLMRLKAHGIDLCAETALFVPTDVIRKVSRFFNRIFVDVKILDEIKCREILGGDIKLYLNNLELLYKQDISICLRHLRIKGYTDDKDTEKMVKELLLKYPNMDYQILEEHYLGEEKRKSIGF